MSKRENEPHRLGNLIPQMLKDNHLEKGMEKIQVREAWEEVMGQGVMNYTTSVEMKGGILIISLSSATLREELEYGKEKILAMLNDYFKGVTFKNIRFI